jgi:branched-chain amino acid transport system permease protein/urea transport system permease protein
MTTFLNSVSLAAILGLVAIGLAVIFGVRGVINLAHGELFVLGAYTTVWFDARGMSMWFGVVASPFVVGAIGWLLEAAVVRRLYTRPLDTLVATFGLSIIIRETIKLTFGKGSRNIPLPMSGQVDVLGTAYPQYRLFLTATSAIILGAVAWLAVRTDIGVKVRAVIQRRSMAEAMGINSRRIDQGIFVMGAALAGFAGALMAPLITLNPEVGPTFLARSFLVVILGGIGSVLAAIGGAIVVGLGEGIISSYIRPVYAQMMLFVAAIVVLCVRPTGLFSRRRDRS